MAASIRQEIQQHIEQVGYLQPAVHQPVHAPFPDEISHDFYRALLRSDHDVGGQPDVPIPWQEKEEEQWELNTYVTCEVLAWRGVWNAEERRRRMNADLGQTQYLGHPYYGRWLISAARVMVDKQHATLNELIDKIDEVKARYESGA